MEKQENEKPATQFEKLAVSEQFFSIQGEGKTIGIPAFFLRLAACNLMCGGDGTEDDGKLHNGATWRCDTIEVWRKGKKKTAEEILAGFGIQYQHFQDSAHLVITGGEPLIQSFALVKFLTKTGDMFVEVETNGTILPGPVLQVSVDQWNVSPKLSNSGMPKERRIVNEAIAFFASSRKSQFKFVVQNEADVEEAIQDFINPFGIPSSQVFLMPGADCREDLDKFSPTVAEIAKLMGYNFSTRLHIAIWNKKTGV